jgi:hypothetical protein
MFTIVSEEMLPSSSAVFRAAVKMMAAGSSETSVNIYQTA